MPVTNPWYQRVFSAIEGSLARAAAVRSEFDLVQAAFDAILAAKPQSIFGLQGFPANFTGFAKKLLEVRADETGVDFVSPWNLTPKVLPGGNYTITAADFGCQLISQSATAINVTVPLNATVAAPAGSCFMVTQEGAGPVTIVPASGVTLDAAGGFLTTRTQFSSAACSVKSLDRWSVVGDLNIAIAGVSQTIDMALSDLTNPVAIAAGAGYWVARYNCTLVEVIASVLVPSTSGLPQFAVKKNGTTMLSTNVTIDANEQSSITAATPPVISVSAIAKGDLITCDIVTAGTGTKGAQIGLGILRT